MRSYEERKKELEEAARRREERARRKQSKYKTCRVCMTKYPKTGEFFYARPDSLDGYRNECKECHKTIVVEE